VRLLGYDLTVSKATLPPGSAISASGTTYLHQQLGSNLPAQGTRPNAGTLPDPRSEAPADPLQFQFPIGTNLAYTPRTGYGLTPFATLRALAATSPEIFTCIQCRKDQMASLTWDFAHRDPKLKGSTVDAKINQARAFFAKPDQVTLFSTWIQQGTEEILTTDALTIYKRRTKGGKIYGYELLDGTTIKPLLDNGGRTPLPPQIAYRQIIYGAPVTGGDCTTNDLIYAPKNVRTWTPYGMSPTEAVVLQVTSSLNRAMYNLSYYVKGNTPEALVGVPDTWQPKQIQQFMEYWDLVLKGDPDNRAGLRFVTQTMAKTVHEFRKADFSTTWELYLLKVICAAFGVTPSEIGFTDDVNKATSKTQGDVNQRRGVKPMAGFWKNLIDSMLATDLGLPEIEATFTGGEGEDALGAAKIQDLQIRNGSLSIDDVLTQAGKPALGIGPCIVTPTGPVLWASVLDPVPDPAIKKPAEPFEDPDPSTGSPVHDDLKKYRTVALKAVKAGKRVPGFTSTTIPTRVLQKLATALSDATTVDDVQKVFSAVSKAQRLSATQKKHQQQMTSTLTALLASEGRAFRAHVAAGLEAGA
jgi:hypothetical protein